MRDRILHYMAQGVPASQVASIVGCQPSYISQLGKDEKFLAQLAEARAEQQGKVVDEDKVLSNKYLAMEHKLLDQMSNSLAFAELPAVTRALEVIANRQENRAKRLAQPTVERGAAVMINITLPSHAVPEYQVNSQREVISIGNRAVAPMSSTGVANLFAQKIALRQEQAQQLSQAETVGAVLQAIETEF